MGRVTRRTTAPPASGLIPPILMKGTSSPQFRPILYGGFASFVGAVIAERVFNISVGWMAVVAGGFALVGIVYYLIVSGRQARQNIERKRAEFFKRFEDPHE